LRFLVTAGPTREFLDPIRFITNRSSGKMGYAIAAAAREYSEQVTLISGPVSITPPQGVEFIPVITSQQMAETVLKEYEHMDVVVMAAAVCDFRPKQMSPIKIKKGKITGILEIESTFDILSELGRCKQSQLLIGFAAETDDVEKNAFEKLRKKNLDLIIANDVSAFDSDSSSVCIISKDGACDRLPLQSKTDLAKEIIRRACQLLR